MKFCSLDFLVLFVLLVYLDVVVSDKGPCLPLPTLKNGKIYPREQGKVVKFVCQKGFQLVGETTAFCTNGTWKKPTTKCVTCPPLRIKNGNILKQQQGRMVMVEFVCRPGSELVGEKTAFCINGTWSKSTPKCVKTTCPKISSSPPNGRMVSSHGGGVLNFYCNPGFDLHGPAAVFCDGLKWDKHMPSCIPSNTKPSLFCDFESSDLCDWTHDLNHDMDWKLHSYKTPSGGILETGPSFDHTKGEGSDGHYMYTEATSRRINDTARLISPIFDKMPYNTCLEFWYHMYGRNTGTLRAYMKKVSDPWPLRAENAIFSKSGNQGDKWYREIINLGVIDQDFQIIMECIIGNGFESNSAIDDVRIIPNCGYKNYNFTSTEAPLPVSKILKSVDSCENRCGNKSSGHEGPSIIPCDCDDSCLKHSRCCPDIMDFCFSSRATSYFQTTKKMQSYTETVHLSDRPTVKTSTTTKGTPPPTVKTTTAKITTTTKKATPTTKTVPPPVTTKKVIPATKKTPPTTKKAPTPLPTKKNNLPTLKTSPTTKRTPPPTVKTTTAKLTTTKKPTPTTKKVPSPVTTEKVIPATKKTPSTTKKAPAPIPTKKNSDGKLPLTSPLPFDEDNNIPLQDREDQDQNNDVNPENIGQNKTESSQRHQTEVSHAKTIFVVIGTLIGVAVLAIVTVLVLVKCVIRPRSRRMMSGYGNSQSNVRFLQAEEYVDVLNELYIS